MSAKPKDTPDLIAGLVLMAVAAFFGWHTRALEIGTSLRMGPGYFPMVLSILLFILGALVAMAARLPLGLSVAESPPTDPAGTAPPESPSSAEIRPPPAPSEEARCSSPETVIAVVSLDFTAK